MARAITRKDREMLTITTTATVNPDHTLTVQLPPDIAPGPHAVVLVVQEQVSPGPRASFDDWPRHDVGPWPENFTIRREDVYGDDGR
jgi:hypothetical protein